MPDLGKTSIGMEPNLAGLLAYVAGWLTGLIFVLVEKENRFVKFHAIQSIGLSIVFIVLSSVMAMIPGIGPILVPLLYLAGLAGWIICMVKAYQGQWFQLPVLGEFAMKQAGGSAAS